MPPSISGAAGPAFLALARAAAGGRPPAVVEVGCGPGRDLAWLEAHGAAVVGLDLSAGMLAQARMRARWPLVQADLRRLLVPGGASASRSRRARGSGGSGGPMETRTPSVSSPATHRTRPRRCWRFAPWTDWTGLEGARAAGWQRRAWSLFLGPFSGLTYLVATVGALQLWRAAQADRPATWRRYRDALALGHSRPLPDHFAAAGVRWLFTREAVREAVGALDVAAPGGG